MICSHDGNLKPYLNPLLAGIALGPQLVGKGLQQLHHTLPLLSSAKRQANHRQTQQAASTEAFKNTLGPHRWYRDPLFGGGGGLPQIEDK